MKPHISLHFDTLGVWIDFFKGEKNVNLNICL